MARSFDPFRDMERLFGEATRTSQPGLAMDLYRTGDHFVAAFDLPGVDPQSIDIDIDDRTLTVRAERKNGSLGEDGKWLVRERPSGTVARQLSLGRGIDSAGISADYRDGVLELTIPVAEESKPRKIAVQHSGGNREIAPEVIEGESEEG
ncbi:Hsp20/alpha crystallin family protein [Tessaracoccus rhinocerotis]|uniref:Hsp20/alpha crystallin family protein n=1 Tax=Tessaracoccus rhinocerotis TaxID=1689449 RepID=A0A553JWX8_9ACTN|nr:Hsp20/alpha crystallin family protein [Tessaracoccus rhinocerotis]TRY16945.1 Hsp20/alpha crystallin family protein [Tessaracoccus rhinocerotis]